MRTVASSTLASLGVQDPALTSFGADFRAAREKARLSLRAVAHIGRLSVEDVRAIEAGSSLPDMSAFGRICAAIPQLRPLRQKVRAALAPAGAPPAEEPVAEPLPALTFPELLRALRVSAGLTLDEVGELVGVTNQSVSAWEGDQTVPVQIHYERLCGVWPELLALPPRGMQEIPPPSGGRLSGAEEAPAAAPESVPPPPPAPAADPLPEPEEAPPMATPIRSVPAAPVSVPTTDVTAWLHALFAASRGDVAAFSALLDLASAADVSPASLAELVRLAAGGGR